MKLWLKVVLIIAALVAGLALLLFGMIYQLMKPTEGGKIPEYGTRAKALLVVDVQEDYTGTAALRPYKDRETLVASTNVLIAEAEKRKIPVVYIENIIDNPVFKSMMKGVNAPGAPGTKTDARILKALDSITLTKNRSDAFSNPMLDEFLRSKKVNELILCGLDGAYCVKSTSIGGLNRGYKVTLIPEAVASESGYPREELLSMWKKAGIEVMSLKDFCAQ